MMSLTVVRLPSPPAASRVSRPFDPSKVVVLRRDADETFCSNEQGPVEEVAPALGHFRKPARLSPRGKR
jgi:hypothetical protein